MRVRCVTLNSPLVYDRTYAWKVSIGVQFSRVVRPLTSPLSISPAYIVLLRRLSFRYHSAATRLRYTRRRSAYSGAVFTALTTLGRISRRNSASL